MLLTVPVLYYKPIQEPALKINRGTKKEDRREEKRQAGTGELGDGVGGDLCGRGIPQFKSRFYHL